MTTGAIAPRLAKLAWPLVVGNLLQTFYNLADMFWVGRVGPNAVAAVSLMFPTAWLFVSVSIGITSATVAVVSQHIGAGEERAAEHAVAQTVLLTIATALGLAAVGYAIRRPLVGVIGAEGVVFDLSVAYLEIILAGIPFTFLFFAFRSALRAAGDTRTAMWLVVVSVVINVALDPFVILGIGPFPALGVEGAAIATVFSRALAAVAGLFVLLHGGWGIRLRLRDLRPDPAVLRKLFDVGYPGTADGLARSLAAVAFAALVARFGPVATAAYGIGLRYMSVSWTVSAAVGQAVATGVGQNIGARQTDRASRITWTATGASAGFLLLIGGVLFAVPDVAMRIFIADTAVIDSGVTFLRIIGPSLAFFGGLMVIQGGFRGAGSTRVAFALSALSRWVFRMPVAWFLAYDAVLDPVDVTGLWWGMAISAVVSFVVGAVWFRRGGWREGVLEGGGETGPDAPVDTTEEGDPDPDPVTD